jgi:hypothetical protein
MSNSSKAHSVRSTNGKVSTQPEPVLPLTVTVKGKPDAAEKARIAADVAGTALQLAELIKGDEAGAFARAKIAYSAVHDRGLDLSAIARATARACARLEGVTDEAVLDALQDAYRVNKSTVSRWVDSYGYPVRAGLVPTAPLVAAVARVLNNNGGKPSFILDSIGAEADGDADAYLAGIQAYKVAERADKAAARAAKKAEADAATSKATGSDEPAPAVPSSPEVVVQDVVNSMTAAVAMRDALTVEQLAAIGDVVTAWIAATAVVTA